MDPEKDYLSQEKFDELNQELDQLKRVRRKEVAERLESAKSMGDLAENAEYHSARDEQADIEDRIAQLENVLKHAEIIKTSKSSAVGIGSTVVIRKKGEKASRQLTIVGSEESNLGSEKISYLSPLGAALLGQKKGAVVAAITPKGKMEYTLVELHS